MTDAETTKSVTDLLLDLQAGRSGALESLMPVVYDELRTLAAIHLGRERTGHTLQPTALVHEVYLRLVDQRRATWENRAHFFGAAANIMRRLIVDHARRRTAQKRGGGKTISLEEDMAPAIELSDDVVRVDEALEVLARHDPRQAKVVELRFFGGLTVEETAEVMGISPITVKREWAMARAWLHRELG